MDKEMILKNYDDALWDLVIKGKSKRKARRILKNVFPEVEYDWKNDTYKIIKDMEGE
ncbi:hypothetical protein [Levilactobacillus brevis]|uniref:hypothetical protein n=1 Tax=Levilactobacillus brevis TaxID=1580 RepID=UPI00177C6DD3|nr:hypothetical protein [Levilactobacillus brevis]